ncbi:MAG: OmpA family protein [Oligoflexia bacterium]|nr:OmpA family protein [Oligoflexia bacterium]
MNWKKFLSVALLVVSVSFVGCSKKQTVSPDEGGESAYSGDSGVDSGMTDSDSGNAMGMQTIRFPYDSFEIVGENKQLLRDNANILKENPTVNIQIEGHCDERGGIQYNLALGEKRANAVMNQLAGLGISKSRITTISMGKEKPVAFGSDEGSWAQNRRANFVITSR